METKAAKPTPPPQNTHPILRAYFEYNHLKQRYRQGWLRRGIPPERGESVAEHSFGVAVLGMLLAERCFPELDGPKIVQMSLIHDFGEVDAGDFTPQDAIPPTEKHALEAQSLAQIFEGQPDGEHYLALWQEFEAGQTPEARLVRQLDKLEMALQASFYARQGFAGLDEFQRSAAEAITHPELQAILQAIAALAPQKGTANP